MLTLGHKEPIEKCRSGSWTALHSLSAAIYLCECARGLLALEPCRKRVDGADVRGFNFLSRFCPTYSQNEPVMSYGFIMCVKKTEVGPQPSPPWAPIDIMQKRNDSFSPFSFLQGR